MRHAAYRADHAGRLDCGEHAHACGARTARSTASLLFGPLALSVLAGAIESCAASSYEAAGVARSASFEGSSIDDRVDPSAATPFATSPAYAAEQQQQQQQGNVVYVQQQPQVVYVQQPPPVVVVVPGYGPLAAKPGFYLTASAIGVSAGGDLDGNSAIVGPAIVFLPDVDAGAGFEIGGGFRSPADAFEITYDHSDHTGSFQGMPLDSTIEAVNFDWKHFFRIEDKLQPYTLFGMNFPWMDIKNGAQRFGQTGDATLYGIGLNLGGGAAYYLTPQLSVSLQGVFRLIDYFEVSALGFSGGIGDDVFSEGWKLSLGTAFTF